MQTGSPRQRRPAADAGRRGPAQRRPRGRRSRRAPRTGSSGSTSTTPTRRSRTRPGSRRRRPTTTRINYVGNQGRAQGAAHFSRLEGAVYATDVVYFTSTQGGGAAETGRQRHRRRATATAAARSGRTTRGQGARARSTSRPGPTSLDFPDNVTSSKRGTLVLCEDNVNDNYLRGLTRDGKLFDIALNRLVSSDRRQPLQRRVRRGHVQPRRPHAVRQHPGQPGMTFAIWGPWGRLGV